MITIAALFTALLGLVIGSFITCLTWRTTHKISLGGRSLCPKCRSPISWYDNIPLVSYLLLGGKCRSCRQKISIRYPLIEATTALVFVSIFVRGPMGIFGPATLPFLLFVGAILIAIAVVDIEHMIIPDYFVGIGAVAIVALLFSAPSPILFVHLFWASIASFLILFLNFATHGQGMGLGDVKLAFLLGLIMGELTWLGLFLAVLTGAVVGVGLILAGRAKLRQPIPFGPFLILGTFIVMLFGDIIIGRLFI